MENSKIEWTHHTTNFWIGCEKISAGCKNCYAETHSNRFKRAVWGKHGTRTLTSQKNRNQPIRWNKQAEKEGTRYRVFAQSLSDTFEDREELKAWRIELFETIVKTPHLDWLVLTKRPEVAKRFFEEYPQFSNLDNVWLGTSVENQEQADIRIPVLLQIPAKIRFLSCEPLLGEVDLYMALCNYDESGIFDYRQKPLIDWVIVGGESGHSARALHPDWVRSIQQQCAEANVPFLFKQWGEYAPIDAQRIYEGKRIDFTDGTAMLKVGKKEAGNMLDGKTYLEFPK
jgi:protein gp37